jgi:hypothetical protein
MNDLTRKLSERAPREKVEREETDQETKAASACQAGRTFAEAPWFDDISVLCVWCDWNMETVGIWMESEKTPMRLLCDGWQKDAPDTGVVEQRDKRPGCQN